MRLTIVGARSFIGLAIATRAKQRDLDVAVVPHDRVPDSELGTVVYCSGIAWGAEHQPSDAYRLHAIEPFALLARGRYDRFLYLSSTRVYDRSDATDEGAELCVDPSDPLQVYPASKIAGESALLGGSERSVVLRLSNVFGANVHSKVFLSDVVRQAVTTARIEIRTALDSSKDYIGVDDVADLVLRIAAKSVHRIYNLAAGRNTTHRQIIDAISALMPVDVHVAPDAPLLVAKAIDVGRIREEFAFTPRDVVSAIPDIVNAFR